MNRRLLLSVDAFINIALGVLFLFLPGFTIKFLGLPITNVLFYPSLLGAVLLGIGIALSIESYSFKHIKGLALAGAISINLLAALCLLYWVLLSKMMISDAGFIILCMTAIILIVISILEIFNIISTYKHDYE